MTDIATGETQSKQGYLNKDNAMKDAIEDLLVRLTASGLFPNYHVTVFY